MLLYYIKKHYKSASRFFLKFPILWNHSLNFSPKTKNTTNTSVDKFEPKPYCILSSRYSIQITNLIALWLIVSFKFNQNKFKKSGNGCC